MSPYFHTSSNNLVQLGIAIDGNTHDVIIVLQIERLFPGNGIKHDPCAGSWVDYQPVWRVKQVLPGVETTVTENELQGEILAVLCGEENLP